MSLVCASDNSPFAEHTELLYNGYSRGCGLEVYAVLCTQVHSFMPKNQVLLPLLLLQVSVHQQCMLFTIYISETAGKS